MEINRNQYFIFGLIILALGIQFRMIESVTLTEEASRFVQQKFMQQKANQGEMPEAMVQIVDSSPIVQKRVISPPKWIGWALISIGCVLILHSLAMQKP